MLRSLLHLDDPNGEAVAPRELTPIAFEKGPRRATTSLAMLVHSSLRMEKHDSNGTDFREI